MFPIRIAKAVVSKAAKPTIYTAIAAAVLWIGVDLFDGASDRFHQRVTQVSTTVREPVEDTSNQVVDRLTHLWENVEANPGPVAFTILTFIVMVILHKRRGHSTAEAIKATLLRESTATRIEPENKVLKRVQQQTIMNEMSAMHEQLLARNDALPALIIQAHKELEAAALNDKRCHEAAVKANDTYTKVKAHHEKLVKEEEDNNLAINELQHEFDKLS